MIMIAKVPLINPGEWGYLPGTNTVTRAVCNSVLEETPQVQEGTVSSQVVRWEDGPAVNRGGSPSSPNRDEMSDAVLREENNTRASIYLQYNVRDAEKSFDAVSRPRTESQSRISLASQDGSDMFDPNFDTESEFLELDSPYPEVRSAVANFDDPTMPVSTLRAWILGIILAMVIPGMNQFFYMRYPSIVVGSLVAQLVVFPVGRLWARIMPQLRIFGVSLNPGPFTVKEHVLVTIMATVGAQSAYATDIVAVQRVTYDRPFGFGYNWMLVMSTQLIGFSIGGIAKRISGIGAYDNTGNEYILSRILTPESTMNMTAYQEYSPLFLPTTFAMSYGLSFLSITATITHAIIYFWKPIQVQFKRSLREQPDIHAQLMSNYSQVPEWYYACIFVSTFAFARSIDWWAIYFHAFKLQTSKCSAALVYIVPIGMIQAITNRQIGLNVVTELIIGYMLPGRPIAMMIFKTFGYITVSQALQFTSDFKLGHYMKIPPRPMFWCQVVATIVAGTTQLAVQTWMFSNIPDLCQSKQQNSFTCNSTRVFGTASIIWGVIGPRLLFSPGQVYYGTCEAYVSLMKGAACPVVLYFIIRKYPNTILSYINFPLIFAGLGMIPPATAVNYVPWVIIGFIFQYLVRRKHFAYWAKYNYVLSAALDAGTAIGVILVYFCLQYPMNGSIGQNSIQKWWGNTVHTRTLDWSAKPYRALQTGETFGPETW
ncbi:hypothetical protein EYR40_001967 [Pleurotus pulmonarius]|nr:hypothetical protein EYR40_001967 [Pleurotus pulmonarius]